MFSKSDTEYLTQTDPGTPMGTLIRRFWIPALVAGDVAEPNGTPVRLRLAGENFVAWRDGAGKLTLFDEYCPHRGASMALGHPEGDGLRCIYHGWKFATDGTTLETPNCKIANFRERVKANVYPVREAGGLIWVYLGPKDKEPPFPHYRFFDTPADKLAIYHAVFACNFVQFMEGTIDPAHANMLHQDEGKLGKRYTNKAARGDDREVATTGLQVEFTAEDDAPECEAEFLTFGVHGVAKFDGVSSEGAPVTFARAHTWVLPFLAVPNTTSFVISVPRDDTHTAFFYVDTRLADVSTEERQRYVETMRGPAHLYRGYHYLPDAATRWGQDRMRQPNSFSAIEGVVTEDAACANSMGAIYDRSYEHLAPADTLIIQMRRRMLRAGRDLEAGIEPFMLQPEEAVEIGSSHSILPEGASWQELMVPQNIPFRVAR